MIPALVALSLAAAPATADAGVAAGRTLTIAFTGDNGGEVAPCG